MIKMMVLIINLLLAASFGVGVCGMQQESVYSPDDEVFVPQEGYIAGQYGVIGYGNPFTAWPQFDPMKDYLEAQAYDRVCSAIKNPEIQLCSNQSLDIGRMKSDLMNCLRQIIEMHPSVINLRSQFGQSILEIAFDCFRDANLQHRQIYYGVIKQLLFQGEYVCLSARWNELVHNYCQSYGINLDHHIWKDSEDRDFLRILSTMLLHKNFDPSKEASVFLRRLITYFSSYANGVQIREALHKKFFPKESSFPKTSQELRDTLHQEYLNFTETQKAKIRSFFNQAISIVCFPKATHSIINTGEQVQFYQFMYELILNHPHVLLLTDDHERTIFHYACLHARFDIFILLLSQGADINALTREGDSALSFMLKPLLVRDDLCHREKNNISKIFMLFCNEKETNFGLLRLLIQSMPKCLDMMDVFYRNQVLWLLKKHGIDFELVT